MNLGQRPDSFQRNDGTITQELEWTTHFTCLDSLFSLEMLGAVMWKEMPSKYRRKPREIQVIAAVKWSCKWEVTQVANGRWPKTASWRATNEGKWVTPTSVASPRAQFSNKHQILVITIDIFWVMWLQSFFPSSWGFVHPTDFQVSRGTWLGFCCLHLWSLIPIHPPQPWKSLQVAYLNC